jgi:hypothetical protein
MTTLVPLPVDAQPAKSIVTTAKSSVKIDFFMCIRFLFIFRCKDTENVVILHSLLYKVIKIGV